MYLAGDVVNCVTEGVGLSDGLSHAEERGGGGDGARENTGEVQSAAYDAIEGGCVRAAGPPWGRRGGGQWPRGRELWLPLARPRDHHRRARGVLRQGACSVRPLVIP